ncbi:TnpV protein [Erysipelatoclostridium ramosum]|nr:TnpV protein [Thomasclavelia ramosa]MCB6435841.1 TnpV protein [Thomasclavelia ramosa]MCB6458890.1 TnpV protein [Thomasclavelia ramosa]MCB6597130.1 TnpV protein [Thomasclavelia ramosa]MCB6600611.1 TnpV protein [Thomasclavelia ramosa]MCB6618710.1 TnpV protein [Thomasclavelia ramosa]
MKQVTYSQVGDYQMPNLQAEQKPLNSHFARLRYQYLKNNHQGHLFSLRVNNKLNQHLMEIEESAQARMETLMEQLLVKHPAPNKEQHQMEWVQHMNQLKMMAEEIILKEIIYS